MTKTEHRWQATNYILADLSREFWPHVDQVPEVWVECEECGGEGSIARPEPFPDDPYFCVVMSCDACHGAGGAICEAM